MANDVPRKGDMPITTGSGGANNGGTGGEIEIEMLPAAFREMMGTPIYDDTQPPVTTYCSECGHETGEERVHAAECQCLACRQGKMWKRIAERPLGKGGTISFPKIPSLKLK